MRASKSERMRAEQFSAAVDQLIADPDARLEGLEPADLGLVEAARQFARLPSLLGSVDPVFEQRVMQQVRQASSTGRRLPFAVGWALAGLAAVLLVECCSHRWDRRLSPVLWLSLAWGRPRFASRL